LQKYGRALDDGRYRTAYGLMSEAFRAEHSQEDFVRLMKENRREAAETAERLTQAPSRVDVSAEFRYGAGDRLRMVREDGRWRISSDPMVFYSQDTPRQALRSFLRAYRLSRWDVMMRFVPNAYSGPMDAKKLEKQFTGKGSEEIARRLQIVESSLDSPLEEKGDQARLRYGDGFEVTFVREAGRWKIGDFY